MIDIKKDLAGWLNQEPSPEDVQNKNGGLYIPIEIIKPRLDLLDPAWSTRNFKHLFFTDHDGMLFCSGSVDLIVKFTLRWVDPKNDRLYTSREIDRTISGAATFNTAEYAQGGNTHYAQTCLSLSIVAAAKELGRYFGRDINKAPEPENKILSTLKNLPL